MKSQSDIICKFGYLKSLNGFEKLSIDRYLFDTCMQKRITSIKKFKKLLGDMEYRMAA